MTLLSAGCHRCGFVTEVERVGVRDTCPGCTAFLHCCRSCALYAPGLHNDCREPAAERVVDKEAGNFCDHFRPAAARAATAGDPSAAARARLEALFRKKE
jgi:hypothetical protein